MKIWTNYREILAIWKRYPQTRNDAEEIELLKIQGHDIKNNIKELKEKLEKILND